MSTSTGDGHELNLLPENEAAFQSPASSIKKKLLLVVGCVLILFSTIVSICTLAIGINHNKADSAAINFCVDCESIKPFGYGGSAVDRLLDSLDKSMVNGVENCCAVTHQQMSAILSLTTLRQDSFPYRQISDSNSTKMNLTDSFTFSSVSAHKCLKKFKGTNTPTQDISKFLTILAINTTHNDLRYEHASGVGLTWKGLRALYSGLYFIYKSVYFVPDTAHPCRDLHSATFQSLLVRNNGRGHKLDTLLRSEHTCCPDCVNNRESAFTGGIFYLNADDIIEVEVSAEGLVYFKEDVTYMGVMMIRPGTNSDAR